MANIPKGPNIRITNLTKTHLFYSKPFEFVLSQFQSISAPIMVNIFNCGELLVIVLGK